MNERMKMKDKIISAILILVIGCVVYLFLQDETSKKIVYFDANTVFDEFNFTKDLEKDLEAEFSSKQVVLDSLKLEMDFLNQQYLNGDTAKALIQLFKSKNEQYLFLENKFMEERNERLTEFNDQVLLQMREYVDLYRIKNNLDMVIGNSSGGMVSASSELDVTKDLVEFINKKYEGVE